jgi:hypothetical protein
MLGLFGSQTSTEASLSSDHMTSRRLELVHSDVMGPMDVSYKAVTQISISDFPVKVRSSRLAQRGIHVREYGGVSRKLMNILCPG